MQEMDGMAGRALRCHCSERVSWYALRRYAGTSHHISRSSQQQFSCSTFSLKVRTVSRLHERAQPQGHKTARSQWVSTRVPQRMALRYAVVQYFAWVQAASSLFFRSIPHSFGVWWPSIMGASYHSVCCLHISPLVCRTGRIGEYIPST